MDELKELRKQKKISQAKLADDLHVTQATVSRWETGEMLPTIDILNELARYFSVSVDYILGNDQKSKPSAEAKSYSKDAIDLLDRIDRLSPANRAKLSELIDLYLSAQDKTQ